MVKATSKQSSAVPDNISEEYYQISQEILASFPKFRPPIDLFQFREDIAQLYPYTRKGTRLTNQQVDQLISLCAEGLLFVSRSDLSLYSDHIIKQIDLVLLDKNFKPAEVAALIRGALQMRIEAFLEQPVPLVFGFLKNDLTVFTEVLWRDKHLIKLFMRRLYTGTYNLSEHMLNAIMTGLWLYIYVVNPKDLKRKELDRLVLALALMNAGMSKIPIFIRDKTGPLTIDEKDKLSRHPFMTIRILQKLDITFDEAKAAALEHHEYLDGSGYPNKTRSLSDIGKLASVADAFSAMISARPYASAKPPFVAAQELARDRRFDQKLTSALLSAYATGALILLNSEDIL